MARNEEQFYGMFKEAFRDFSPEAPAHVFEGVQASLGKERSFSGARWLWAGALVFLLGSGAFWLYINSGKNELAASPATMSTNVNGAIYKAHWSIGVGDTEEEFIDSESVSVQVAMPDEPAPRKGVTNHSILAGETSIIGSSSPGQATLPVVQDPSPETNPAQESKPAQEAVSGTSNQDSSNGNVTGASRVDTPETIVPESRKFVIQGKKTITIDEE